MTTSQGIILIDTLFTYNSEEEIVGGLKKLGVDPAMVKYVIISHAHADHMGGGALDGGATHGKDGELRIRIRVPRRQLWPGGNSVRGSRAGKSRLEEVAHTLAWKNVPARSPITEAPEPFPCKGACMDHS